MSSKILGLFLTLCASLGLSAQTHYKIQTITFQNPGPYSQAQLLAASGVKPGDPATAATLQAAAQKLSDSGFFEDIGAEYSGMTNAIVAVFKLKPLATDHMLPAGFENFIWLTHDELQAAIRADLPLYSGYLVEGTPQSDLVASALQRALASKAVAATLEHETVEPTLNHPVRSIEFRVRTPRPVIANIKLEGVSHDLVPLVQKAVNDTARTPYNDGLAGALTTDRILAPLLDAGYINAALTGVSTEAEGPPTDRQPIVLHATLSAGDIYHLSALNFAGSPLMTPEAFVAGVKLHAGDVASHKALVETLIPLDAAYRKQGFLDVILKADPTEDPATHQVAYTVSVIPGEPYHVSKVTADGLDPVAKADFEQHFLLKPGDVYNPFYVASFIKNNTALKSLATYTGSFKAYSDPNNHTTEVVLTFFNGPTVNVH